MIKDCYKNVKITKKQIIVEVCRVYEVSEEQLLSTKKSGNCFNARAAYMLLMLKFIDENTRNYHTHFNGNNKFQAYYLKNKATELFDNSLTFRNNYNVIENNLIK